MHVASVLRAFGGYRVAVEQRTLHTGRDGAAGRPGAPRPYVVHIGLTPHRWGGFSRENWEFETHTLGQQPTRPRRFAQRVSAALLHHTGSRPAVSLCLDQASLRIGPRHLVRDVTLELAPARITAIVGPKGTQQDEEVGH